LEETRAKRVRRSHRRLLSLTRLFSAALRGVDAIEVEVEVNARDSDKPPTLIVGLRESSQRNSKRLT
jgi:hypothetical protein